MIADFLFSSGMTVAALIAVAAGVYFFRGVRATGKGEASGRRLQSFGDIVHGIAARGCGRRARLSVHCTRLVLAEARCSARSGK
jgi:hypothetical protein